MKMDTPLLSVVIIGLNEAQNIGRCIDQIKLAVAEIPGTEIVYVDSGSSDDTVAISLSKGVRVFQLGKAQPPSPSAGRYVGSLVTTGRFIMFVDADTMVGPDWIKPALDMMIADTSIAMFSGTHCTDPSIPLEHVQNFGAIETRYKLSGSWAPIVSREILEQAGNWNPFLGYTEEEDLAIRIRYYVPGSRILRSERVTVFTPKCPGYKVGEFLRRIRRGFVKGPGRALRNAIRNGYWKHSWHMAKQMILVLMFSVALVVSVALGYWCQFLIAFFAIVLLRAVVTRKFIRFAGIYCSFLMGFCNLWEFLSCSPKSSSDYIRDFEERPPSC